VQKYVQNPGSNPHLGDASPVIHRFDPFRDGKASQRIGEYVGWYLEGLDSGLDRDRSLEQASRRYADRWGSDKVIRGLSANPASASGSAVPSDQTTPSIGSRCSR
jgi:hypothetical protein